MSYSLSAILKRLLHPRPRPQPVRRSVRLNLEALEGRLVPAPLVVTTNADGGLGSLRAVVSGANNGDVIHFAPALAGKTITLTSGQINLNKSLTIDGQANNVTIDGGGSFRIFYNPLPSLSEEIDNLTLQNGKVTVGARLRQRRGDLRPRQPHPQQRQLLVEPGPIEGRGSLQCRRDQSDGKQLRVHRQLGTELFGRRPLH